MNFIAGPIYMYIHTILIQRNGDPVLWHLGFNFLLRFLHLSAILCCIPVLPTPVFHHLIICPLVLPFQLSWKLKDALLLIF